MTLKFNPPRTIAKYALFVDRGHNKGTFKSFDKVEWAKLSWKHHTYADYGNGSDHDAKILENIDGNWYVLYDIPKGTAYTNRPWAKEAVSRWGRKPLGYTVAVAMSKEDYAEFRVKVAREQWQEELVKGSK